MTEQNDRADLNVIGNNFKALADQIAAMGQAAQNDEDGAATILAASAVHMASSLWVDITRSLRGIEAALVTIAHAQTGMLNVATADLNEIVNETIKEGVDKGVQDAMNKRSFIGRVPD